MLLKIWPWPLFLALLIIPGCFSGGGESTFSGRHGRETARASRVEQVQTRSLAPSYREQRQARATVEALEENKKALGKVGADFALRNDGTASRAHQVRFVSSPGALTLDVQASPGLNMANGAPHALRLVVYHLADTAVMDQLASSKEGIVKLLKGDSFDESVRGIRILDIQPGQECRLQLDRAENGQYVALVAGYHQPDRARCVSALSYPISQFFQNMDGLLVKRNMAVYSPRPLHLRVSLDEHSMSTVRYDEEHARMAQAVSTDRSAGYWAR